MKKIIALFLILVLPIALSLTTGCSKKEEAPVATEEEAPAVEAPAAEAPAAEAPAGEVAAPAPAPAGEAAPAAPAAPAEKK